MRDAWEKICAAQLDRFRVDKHGRVYELKDGKLRRTGAVVRPDEVVNADWETYPCTKRTTTPR